MHVATLASRSIFCVYLLHGGAGPRLHTCRYLLARGPQERIALLQTEISAHHSEADTVSDWPPRPPSPSGFPPAHGLRRCPSRICILSLGFPCAPSLAAFVLPQVSHSRRVNVHVPPPKNVPLSPAASQIHPEHHHRRHLRLGHVKSSLIKPNKQDKPQHATEDAIDSDRF